MGIKTEKPDRYFDEYVDFEDGLLGRRDGKGRKRSKKEGPTKSDKSQKKAQISKERAKRKLKVKVDIGKDISSFQKLDASNREIQVGKYLDWLNNSLWVAREPVIDEGDFKIDTFRSGKPGGQRRDKKRTAVRITHIPTRIFASNENQRTQPLNREAAEGALKVKLQEHYDCWKRLIDNSDEPVDLKNEVFRIITS